MSAPLSVVIPVLNAAADLPAMAEALLPGLTDGLIAEMILSDGGSSDGIAEVAEALGAVLLTGPAGRGGQIARGVAAARKDWVLILHADTWLSADWPAAVVHHIHEHPDQAGWFRLRFRADGVAPRLVERGALLRARHLRLPYGDQGLLVSKSVLAQAGGIPDLPLMEDVALARQLKGRLRELPAVAHTSAARYERDGWFKRATKNLTTLARYKLGADPAQLVKRYERS